jgi:very-short-patch-repair endonuclease
MNKQTKQRYLAENRKKLLKNRTTSELAVEKLLLQAGFRAISQKGFLTTRSFIIADFYLPKPHKLIIEVDGSSHDRKQHKDLERDCEMLLGRGIRTLRIKNDVVATLTTTELSQMIASFLAKKYKYSNVVRQKHIGSQKRMPER